MMMKEMIHTMAAPLPSGTYSQAIHVGHIVYLAGQIPIHPETKQLVEDDFRTQVKQVFLNLRAVCEAAGGGLNNIVKLSVYLMDLAHFSIVNEVMAELFEQPYPARTTIQVSQLPKGAQIEVDGMMQL